LCNFSQLSRLSQPRLVATEANSREEKRGQAPVGWQLR